MIPSSADLRAKAQALVTRLAGRRLTVATAESCTGGMISACISDVPGSSAVLDRGFVTYSNAAKSEMLGVPPLLIAERGAVSAQVACAMAQGALAASRAGIAVAVTGVAGPGGGSDEKPVGLVHFALATATDTRHEVRRFGPRSRDEIRRLTVALALELLDQAAGTDEP